MPTHSCLAGDIFFLLCFCSVVFSFAFFATYVINGQACRYPYTAMLWPAVAVVCEALAFVCFGAGVLSCVSSATVFACRLLVASAKNLRSSPYLSHRLRFPVLCLDNDLARRVVADWVSCLFFLFFDVRDDRKS